MRTLRAAARLGVLALATGSVAAIAAAAPASAGTNTYSQPGAVTIGQATSTVGGAGLTVNDNATATPYPSTVAVSGLVGTITDVNLRLQGVTHGNADDLDVMLVSPSGKRSVVMSDAGGANVLTAVNITLDDQAAQDLPDSTAITTGTYRPKNYEPGDPFPAPAPDPSVAGSTLGVFNDSSPNGTWQLFVLDDTMNAKAGSITEWRLEVTTTGTQPYPSTLTVSGAEKKITDVNVRLNGFTHTAPADVDMLLVGPGGQQATILSDAGSDTDVSGVNLVLDDAAASQVGTPLVSGTFQPTNFGGPDAFPAPAPVANGDSTLAVFNGTDPNGTWKLYVVDDTPGDTGALTAGWALQISTVDITGPTVVKTTPPSGKTKVSRTANITATFSEAVRAKTVTTKTFYLERVSNSARVRATVTYNADTKKATLNPQGSLRAHTKYRAVVTTKVLDKAGNALDQNPSKTGNQRKAWTFTTK